MTFKEKYGATAIEGAATQKELMTFFDSVSMFF